MNYEKIISTVREIARDQIRLEQINRIKTQITELNSRKTACNSDIEEHDFRILVNEFKINEIKENDPEKEYKKKNLIWNIEAEKTAKESNNKKIETVDLEIKKKEEEISSWSAGKNLVSLSLIETIAQELIESVVKQATLEKIKEEETKENIQA